MPSRDCLQSWSLSCFAGGGSEDVVATTSRCVDATAQQDCAWDARSFYAFKFFYQAGSRSNKRTAHSFFFFFLVPTLLPSFRHWVNATFIVEKGAFVHFNPDPILHPKTASITLFAWSFSHLHLASGQVFKSVEHSQNLLQREKAT